jgi:hypothetical protein
MKYYNGEVFTLPHIVRLDSTGLQVIFQSPPGVQVPFFWWGHSQIMVLILPGLHPDSSRSSGEPTGVSGLQVPITGTFPLFNKGQSTWTSPGVSPQPTYLF